MAEAAPNRSGCAQDLAILDPQLPQNLASGGLEQSQNAQNEDSSTPHSTQKRASADCCVLQLGHSMVAPA